MVGPVVHPASWAKAADGADTSRPAGQENRTQNALHIAFLSVGAPELPDPDRGIRVIAP